MIKTSTIAANLTVYGLTHALVDAGCVALLLTGIDAKNQLITCLLLYNMLAFGLQLPFGWIVDRLHVPVITAVAGCIMLATGLMLFMYPLAASILAGIGNALFHVGGGTVSLNLKPGKAALPGIFVAPGAIGLFVGGIVTKFYGFHPFYWVVLLLVGGLIMTLLKSPPINYQTKKTEKINYLVLAIILILTTISIRSVIGLSLDFPWKSKFVLLLILTLSIALGKGLGGFLADRFGWKVISAGGLTVSAFMLYSGQQSATAGIIGLFLFNFTMPVTLVAISNLLPGRPGFSFGLTTFALAVGSLPTYFNFKSFFSINTVVLIMVLISSAILLIGLRLYEKVKP